MLGIEKRQHLTKTVTHRDTIRDEDKREGKKNEETEKRRNEKNDTSQRMSTFYVTLLLYN